jgi:hypothetical protein
VEQHPRRRRKIIQLAWDLALVCTIAAMLAGVWFAFLSWQLSSPMFGMLSLKGFLVFVTFACTVTAVAYLPWLATRERRLYGERAELQQRLGEVESRGA